MKAEIEKNAAKAKAIEIKNTPVVEEVAVEETPEVEASTEVVSEETEVQATPEVEGSTEEPTAE